jgi:hypothetical protein
MLRRLRSHFLKLPPRKAPWEIQATGSAPWPPERSWRRTGGSRGSPLAKEIPVPDCNPAHLELGFRIYGNIVAFLRMRPVFESAKSAKSDGKIPAKMRKSLSDHLQVLKSQLIAWTKLTPACPKSAKSQNRQNPGALYMQNNIFYLSSILFSLYILYIIFFFSKREETN